MIPADVAKSLQVAADAALRPVAPEQELADRLAGLTAGDKVMAQIQAALPNGTYRALINQRVITLALPFSAKSGDSLELLVTESEGKMALAVVTHREGGEGKAPRDAVSATLSRTAQFIGQLFSRSENPGEGTKALPLNSNEPIANAPPRTAQDILPLLKQAITQSGMFYEAHQAEWVEGRFAKAALLQEPQGQLSAPKAFVSAAPEPLPQDHPPARIGQDSPPLERDVRGRAPVDAAAPPRAEIAESAKASSATTQAILPQGQPIAPQTHTIVQQQLEALSTQNFAWQGQIWPGQEMRWEIEENGGHQREAGEDVPAGWSTRLHLVLPRLGGIHAQLQLRGDQVVILLSAENAGAATRMQEESENLRQQMHEAGLLLTSIGIAREPAGKRHEPTGPA